MIREATEKDIPLLAEMNYQLIHDEGHRNSMSIKELETRMMSFINKGYQVVVFEGENGIEGYCLWRGASDHNYIRQFYIKGEHRRKGLGQNYFQQLKHTEWRGKRLRLEVLVNNKQAQEFWAFVGFKEYAITMELE